MIKNIKIFNKPRLKKLKLYALPFMIASTILTGCSTKDLTSNNEAKTIIEINNDVNDKVNSNEELVNNINNISNKKTTLSDEELKIIDEDLNLEDIDLEEFKNSIDNEVEYRYSEYFEIDKALEKYETLEEKDTYSTNIIKDKKVDVSKLLKNVLKNNEQFLKEGVNSNIFSEFSNSEVEEICNIIANVLNKKMNEIDFDIDELDEYLSQLKILSYSKYEYATITEDGCLAINKTMIDTLDIENKLEKILTHESIHLIQKGSKEEQELEGYSKNVGMNYKFDDLNINSLYNQWVIEASAEKSASKINNEEVLYSKNLRYLDAISIAMAFDKYNVEDLDITKNLDAFYEAFSCDGLISKEEIATMMYSIEFINYSDDYNNEFLKYYREKTGKDLSYTEIENLKNHYNSAIYKTLSKKLYYDLTKKVKNQSLSIKDVFSIIAVFEANCYRNTKYYDDYRLEENKSFIEEYTKLQNEFFNLIATNLYTNVEEIQKTYNYYYSGYSVEIQCTNKNDDLNKIYSKYADHKGISISEMNNIVQNSNVK